MLRIAAAGQRTGEKILYMVDSLPVIHDPEPWNPILPTDIADRNTVRDKATLKQLGWEEVDAITFLFTKEYRNRPDSIRQIPGLRNMVPGNGIWLYKGKPYSGTFINYYNSGKKMSEGTLLEGSLNGEVTVYFKSGIKKSVAVYRNGLLHGPTENYYPNGNPMRTDLFVEGKLLNVAKGFFVNGVVQSETRLGARTPFDTVIVYYSNGTVKTRWLVRNGIPKRNGKEADLNILTVQFDRSLQAGDLKEANKIYFKIWKLDSTSSDTYYLGGVLLLKEFRFKEAISEFDKALQKEPMLREALAHRALARIYQYKYPGMKSVVKPGTNAVLTLDGNLSTLPADEQEKICADLQRAKYLDFTEQFLEELFPGAILKNCLGSIVQKISQ